MGDKAILSFESDIKDLFREKDRQAMLFFCDLHNYDDVFLQADRILERLDDGSMPCDNPWGESKIKLFRDWLIEGKNP